MSHILPSPCNTPDGLEPRFLLPPSTPRSSKTPLCIGGVQAYVYGLDELNHAKGAEVAVLYLAHNRTRTYLVTEGIAHEILHRYRTDGRQKKVEMIALTMNMRNHGDREVSMCTSTLLFCPISNTHRSVTRQIGPGLVEMRTMGTLKQLGIFPIDMDTIISLGADSTTTGWT